MKYPFVASIGFAYGDSYYHYCGASLITPTWVLTAAHCVINNEDFFLTNGRVILGLIAQSSYSLNTEIKQIVQVRLHPQYNDNTVDYDFALLKLDSNSTYAPVALTTTEPVDKTPCITMGWGALSSGGSSPDLLQEVEVEVDDTCGSYPTSMITDRMLCAAAPGRDSCQGDSGGPLVVKLSDGSYEHIGIVSWGYGCALANYPGVYAAVSVGRQWILGIVQNDEVQEFPPNLPPPPPPPPLPPIISPPPAPFVACANTCNYADDTECDDGGPGSEYAICGMGTDCIDCGWRGNYTDMAIDCDGRNATTHMEWIGDGHCDDGGFGYNFNCAEHECDGGDCACPGTSTSPPPAPSTNLLVELLELYTTSPPDDMQITLSMTSEQIRDAYDASNCCETEQCTVQLSLNDMVLQSSSPPPSPTASPSPPPSTNTFFTEYETFGDYNDRVTIYKPLSRVLDYMRTETNPNMELRIGTSENGRDIYAFQYGSITNPGFVMTCTVHAREWISPMSCAYIAKMLSTETIFDSYSVYIVPVANPDGYEYSWATNRDWRKNRRNNGDGTYGVDVNRNFPDTWNKCNEVASTVTCSSSDSSSDTYRGPTAGSEPETVAILSLVDTVATNYSLAVYLDTHSYSAVVSGIWSWTSEFSDIETQQANAAQLIVDNMNAVANYGYEYWSSQDWSYYADGTAVDSMYLRHDTWSWLYELRPRSYMQGGFELPDAEILDTCREAFAGVVTMAQIAQTSLQEYKGTHSNTAKRTKRTLVHPVTLR